ncbi:hypothetical protein TrLO_g14719 [Triparma laevis f. longispina]|uniref:Uncharacterized protein n=1 Tax=Triparma laevis f. longispina TaxID=1714387 RepID=A0A9W7B094_9STRA|nr:hypothetical protein TrLO_g14719 [Triparma laevis f. longispina]
MVMNTPLQDAVRLLLEMKESGNWEGGKVEEVLAYLSNPSKVNDVDIDEMIGKLLESNSSSTETHQKESSNAAVFLRNHQQHNRRHSTLPINVKAMYTKIGRQRSSFDKPSIQTGEDSFETNTTPISGIGSDWNFEIHSIPSNPLHSRP